MRYLSWALFCVLLLPGRGEEALKNTDFSQGTTHWVSDGKVPQADNPDGDPFATAAAAPAKGMLMELRPSRWSKMSQEFEPRSTDYTLTMVYSLGDGTSFSNRAEDYVNVAAQIGCTGLVTFNTPPGEFVIMVIDSAQGRFSYYKIKPSLTLSGTQTFTGRIGGLIADGVKGLIIAFPPGNGSVTIQSISLSN